MSSHSCSSYPCCSYFYFNPTYVVQMYLAPDYPTWLDLTWYSMTFSTAPPQSLLYHPTSMWCTVLERLGSPFSTILYGSLQLWERISLWQCREYQGRPNEALLCKMFGAVFIPDGIVWDFRPLWRAVSRNIDWKNGFTTAKEATLNQTNANKFYLYLLAIFFSKCSISAIYFCSLGREGLQFRQRKLNRTFIQ